MKEKDSQYNWITVKVILSQNPPLWFQIVYKTYLEVHRLNR